MRGGAGMMHGRGGQGMSDVSLIGSSGGNGSTQIGSGASATGADSIAIGTSASATGASAIAIGKSAAATAAQAIAIGEGASNAVANSLVIGGTTAGQQVDAVTFNSQGTLTFTGSGAASGGIKFVSTSDATKGLVQIGATPVFTVDEANARVGIGAGATAPAAGYVALIKGAGSKGSVTVLDNAAAQLTITSVDATNEAQLFVSNTSVYGGAWATTIGTGNDIAVGSKVAGSLGLWTDNIKRGEIDENGNFALAGLGGLAVGATNGFPAIPSMAGAPTGTPTILSSNVLPVVLDRTNRRLYVNQASATWDRVDFRLANQTITSTGNVGAGEDDLHSHTVAADMLAADGQSLEFEFAFTFAANANNKRVRVKWGATTIYDSTAIAQNGGALLVRGRIVRTGAATQRCIVTAIADGTTPITDSATYTTAAETLSGTVVLKATGEATDNDDIVNVLSSVRWCPAV